MLICDEGHHANGSDLAIIKRSREKKEQERLVKGNKKQKECQDNKRKISGVLTKGAGPSKWNVSDLKVNGSNSLPTLPCQHAHKIAVSDQQAFFSVGAQNWRLFGHKPLFLSNGHYRTYQQADAGAALFGFAFLLPTAHVTDVASSS
jgi:hypothetical protein